MIARAAQIFVKDFILFVSFWVYEIGVFATVACCNADCETRTSANGICFCFHDYFVLDLIVVVFVVEVEPLQVVVGVKQTAANADAHPAYSVGKRFGEVYVNRARFVTHQLVDCA